MKKFALSFALCAAFAAAQDFRWNKAPAAGQTVEIRGVNGSVTVDEGAFEVTATKKGSKAATVTIEAVEHAGGVTICAVYPATDGRANECRPGGGRMNNKNNDTSVHFTVRMPASLKLAAVNVNGDITTKGKLGEIRATTVNGTVSIASASFAEATSVNGGINIALTQPLTRPLKLSTVNGAIKLSTPSTLNAELSASTVNGDIQSDYPITVTGKFGPRSVKATLGSGGPALNLSTVNGGIHLSRI